MTHTSHIKHDSAGCCWLCDTQHGPLQDDVKQELVDTSERLITAQAQRDRNAMKLEQLAQQHGGTADDQASGSQDDAQEPELTVLTGHLNRIAALEKEVKRLKQVCPCPCIAMLMGTLMS